MFNTITSREEAISYLEKDVTPHPWHRAICLDYRAIGYTSVKLESGEDKCRAKVSFAVGADYWGQGIVTRTLKVAISLVFKEFPDLIRLEALVEFENSASQRVLEKVGFLKEGLLRKYGFNKGEIKDVYIYTFLSADKII
ncbi:FkbH domain containing protein [Parasponia andersonii]|uniref:FkbH domain containing protein n=1 Tax=Parasponia andersonii TaxID=3476 RepID=A0A2P5E3B3_PARAD|nr:FkbH domain containing protein [Parasponia andersonii]